MDKTMHSVKVDKGWVELIKHAKELGLSTEEVREFLMNAGQKV